MDFAIKNLANAPTLTCSRYGGDEDPVCDDMDETEYSMEWKQMSNKDKIKVLEIEIEKYWNESPFDSKK